MLRLYLVLMNILIRNYHLLYIYGAAFRRNTVVEISSI